MDIKKRHRLLTAARSTFLRYGYKRVAMSDLAEAAGISRPALYLIFKSKEMIFNGVYEQWVEETIAEIGKKMDALEKAEDKLCIAFELWAVQPFEWMRQSSEAKELMECAFGFAQDSLTQGYKAFDKILLPVIKTHPKFQASKTKVSAEKTAHILSSAVRGFKLAAKDSSEIRTLIKDLIALTF